MASSRAFAQEFRRTAGTSEKILIGIRNNGNTGDKKNIEPRRGYLGAKP